MHKAFFALISDQLKLLIDEREKAKEQRANGVLIDINRLNAKIETAREQNNPYFDFLEANNTIGYLNCLHVAISGETLRR